MDVTFTSGGTEYTCTLSGTSSYFWFQQGDATNMLADTVWSSNETDDPCPALVDRTRTVLEYKEEDGRSENVQAATPSHRSDVEVNEAGAITDMSVTHEVRYRCDHEQGQPTLCTSFIVTNPK